MDANQKFLAYGALGLAAVGVLVGWLNYKATGQLALTPQGPTINLPGGSTAPPPPPAFVFPTFTPTYDTIGGSGGVQNPGNSVIFNFPPPPAAIGMASPSMTAQISGAHACACGTNDGVASPCNSGPGNTVAAFGDPASAAAAIGANLGPTITAAFNAGEQLRHEQNLALMANFPTGSAIYVPPGPALRA